MSSARSTRVQYAVRRDFLVNVVHEHVLEAELDAQLTQLTVHRVSGNSSRSAQEAAEKLPEEHVHDGDPRATRGAELGDHAGEGAANEPAERLAVLNIGVRAQGRSGHPAT